MGVNKVVYGNETLIDLTSDTVSSEVLLSGYTAHNAAGNLITGSASSGTNAYDYVVEESHNSSSGYRKWYNGTLECWVNKTVSLTVNTAWGNLYRSSSIEGPNWPEEFTTIVHSYATAYASGEDMATFGSSGGQSVTKATNGYLLRGQSLTSAKSFVVSYYAVGTWAGGASVNNADETSY